MKPDFDVLIVGGGLIGNSLAAALSGQGLKLGIIEAKPPADLSYDDGRSIAISHSSQCIFEALGVNVLSTPIFEIHVSDKGHFGKTRLKAEDYQVEALGRVVGINPLSKALLDAVGDVELISPATVSSIAEGEVTISLDGGERTLSTQLLVAADGANSSIRKLLNVDATVWDYGQHAVVANVELHRDHEHIAHERFTDKGPFAILPLSFKKSALVWALKNADLDRVRSLSDDDFLLEAQKVFGYQLGKFLSISPRQYFPLKLHQSKSTTLPGVVFIGNAAQTLHPFAAQGFNLGLRDVATLAEVCVDADRQGKSLRHGLKKFEAARRADKREMIAFCDGVPRLFSHDFLPYNVGRNVGLMMFDLFPPLKNALARRSLGISGRSTRLARGLPL